MKTVIQNTANILEFSPNQNAFLINSLIFSGLEHEKVSRFLPHLKRENKTIRFDDVISLCNKS